MDVTREDALATCEQVRADNRRRYFGAAYWQCWGCMRFGGRPEKRCMHTGDAWNGCKLINARLEDSV
jgi:hypothetical protein